MIIVYESSHISHNPGFEIYDGVKTKYPETPDRIETIAKRLAAAERYSFVQPRQYSDDEIFALHKTAYVNYVQSQSNSVRSDTDLYPSNFIHDTYAPIVAGTYAAAQQSLRSAMTGADYITEGKRYVYALCRPPGHHAGDGYMGGYCYFNNAAIAAHRLSKTGRVSILDIDFHHGNGTQQLFYDCSDVQYVSVHANPRNNYPYTHGYEEERGEGAGLGYNHNFLFEKNCGYTNYLEAFLKAIESVQHYAPDYLVVSLGFDGYKNDPIAGFDLSVENYAELARIIANLQIPTLLIQEGGYCVEALGDLAQNFTAVFE